MSACVFMCGSVQCLNVRESLNVSQSPLFSLDQSLYPYPPSSFFCLLPCTSRCPRVWFPVVGPAVSALSYLLKMLPLFVPWTDGGAQGRDVLHGSGDALVHLVHSCVLPCPNLLTNLVDCAEVGVVHQLHEVPVPKLLIGHWGRASAAMV